MLPLQLITTCIHNTEYRIILNTFMLLLEIEREDTAKDKVNRTNFTFCCAIRGNKKVQEIAFPMNKEMISYAEIKWLY